MITLNQAKTNLLKEILTPSGPMVLYGINLLPNSDAIGLIFYDEKGKQKIFFSIDTFPMNNKENNDSSGSLPFYKENTKRIFKIFRKSLSLDKLLGRKD